MATKLEKAEARVAELKAAARKRDIKKAAGLLQYAANLLCSLDVRVDQDEHSESAHSATERVIKACKREVGE